LIPLASTGLDSTERQLRDILGSQKFLYGYRLPTTPGFLTTVSQ
jgi:hypothetical protein